ADVTDTAGETRSDNRSVAVGYTALQANLSADDWQAADRAAKVIVTTQTLDGEGQAAKGTVKVYRLKQPEKVHRPDILDRPAPAAAKLALKVPHLFAAPKWSLEPGEKFTALWGTGYDAGRAFVELEHRNRIIQSYWTDPAKTQVPIAQQINDDMRGGFTVRV